MATILLSAAGAAIGSGFGGTVLGLSGAVVGRAVGATLGRAIDQRLLGAGSDAVEVGRVDRFRLMGASEGAAVSQVFGRVRIAGQVIWANRFMESSTVSGGGKGAPSPKTTSYSYTVSLAIALCTGTISGVGRVWADGVELAPRSLNMRVYNGGEDQLPDPKIEAVEGAGQAPAYRGIAYVVIEDLELGRFGNRVPQFSFEVMRPAQGKFASKAMDIQRAVRAVALIPGTGEYSLATTQVHYAEDEGVVRSANVNSPAEAADFTAAMEQLSTELPNCGSVSLVVSWFGDDLRCGECRIVPKVEQKDHEGQPMAWRAGGIVRAEAEEAIRVDARSVYGGTPSDDAVVEAIRAIRASGKEVMFYPFILMEQLAGNGRADPWSGAADQPVLPWRGRITLGRAPGRGGTTDRSGEAEAEVEAFFGTAAPGDFAVDGGRIVYSGPAEWRYRRFILHYAHLCALAGGVDAFCIGSEMVALTQVRGEGDSFPAVAALRRLAAEVRGILGPEVKLSYAADWSEYFGFHADGNVYFHLDPLWADPNIDFVGIDNYMPLADWRDGETHADAAWGSMHSLEYLKANIEGGEGFDWYYDGPEGEQAQRRIPITDGAHDEPWVYRYKDIRNWWSNPHHDRIGGVRSASQTAWIAQSKPIRFTEYGCAAIDKGANQPNKFLDPKSSESRLPKYSSGRRDDLMQMQYLRAMAEYWNAGANNPVSAVYGNRMLDMARAHVWAWDARPFPYFPNNTAVWGDGENYARGHWLTGRATSQTLAAVVAELCERSGLHDFDVSGLYGVVRGLWLSELGSARAALQSLMLAYGFDAVERNGILIFRMRDGRISHYLKRENLATLSEISGELEASRAGGLATPGHVLVGYIEAEGDYSLAQSDAHSAEAEAPGVSQTDLPLVLTAAESRGIAEKWLAEAGVTRESARFALPRSALMVGVGDVVDLEGHRYRIDRIEQAEAQIIDAVKVEPGVYRLSDAAEERVIPRAFVSPAPVLPIFLDLPLLTGEETAHAPHIAVAARPWPGSVAVWSAGEDAGYEFNRLVPSRATIGRTQSVLHAATPGMWDRGPALRVRMSHGTLSSASELAVLNGANAMAIGDGSADRWEVFQFQTATLVAPGTYELSMRLRGQAGSDGTMPEVWPIGSRVVLLNRSLVQIDHPHSARGIARHYRIGASGRGYDDQNTTHRVVAFDGIGLRPYAPAHLRAEMQGSTLRVTWVRRTRIDGDSWQAVEVPLGEEAERYQLRIWKSGSLIRDQVVNTAEWQYAQHERQADGASGSIEIAVAQISERFGAGAWRTVSVVL